jgi:1,4-dihydroxy-2-naphthoyl-CoA synthase
MVEDISDLWQDVTGDGIAWILINHPEVANAVRPMTMQELRGALVDAVADPRRWRW